MEALPRLQRLLETATSLVFSVTDCPDADEAARLAHGQPAHPCPLDLGLNGEDRGTGISHRTSPDMVCDEE